MSKFVHIFPLSVYRDTIAIPAAYKAELVNSILQSEAESQADKPGETSAWLGDTSGHEFLFQNELGRG